MSLAPKILPNYTYDDYIQWKGDWEIIDGIAYAMSPSPTYNHQKIASNLHILLANALDKSGCECDVIQQFDIKIEENTVVNPDLLIVCENRNERYLSHPPALVIEIFSPSSILRDQITKRKLYEDFGINYYIMVDPESKELKILQLINGEYSELNEPFDLILKDGCKIALDLTKIWD